MALRVVAAVILAGALAQPALAQQQTPGTIIIVKDAIPNDPQDFSFADDIEEPNTFTLDDDADGSLSNTRTFLNVAPGRYQVAEMVPEGWVFDESSSCLGNGSFDGPYAFIILDPGETVTCTFINAKLSDVGFSKTFLPNTIGPDSTTQLRFDIDNSASATPVTDLAFTDVLPAGVTIATPSSAFTDCENSNLSAPDGGGTISVTGGRLEGSGSCEVTVDVTTNSLGAHLNVSGDLTSSDGNSGAAAATLTVDPARPSFSKAFAPSSIPLGGSSTLTLSISSGSGASPLGFTDIFPTGMVLATPPNSYNTCGGTLFLGSGGVSDNGVSLVSGSIGGESTCTVEVDVTTDTTGVFVNTTSELLSGPTPVSSGFATAVLDVPIEFLNKVFLDDPVAPGGSVTLQFTIQNPSRTAAATDIAFTDDLTFLTDLTANLPSNPDPPCGAGSSLTGTTTLTFAGGSLPAGGSCTFSVPLTVPPGATPDTYTNTTTAVTATIDGDGVVGNAATDELVVSLAPTFKKEFLTNPVGAGGTTTLRFTITNNSSTSSLSDIAFEDVFDDVVPTASVVPSNPVCNTGTAFFTPYYDGSGGSSNDPARFTVTGASLGASETCTIDLTLDVVTNATEGTYPNTTTTITGLLGGEEPVEGFPATDDLVVVGGPSMIKEFTDDPVDPGTTATLEFTLTHSEFAGGPATGIAFTDDLAAALAGLTATGLPMNDLCGPGNGSLTGTAMDTSLTFSDATLTPGETCAFSVSLDVPVTAAPGPHTNTTSTLTATVGGVAVTGNPASDDLHIAGLTLTKEFTDDPVLPGDTVTLEFVIKNVSLTDTATSITIYDDLATILGGSPDITGDGVMVDDLCGPGNGSVSWSSGNTFMAFSGGTLAPGETCTFSVLLNVPSGAASGTYTNSTGTGTGPGFFAMMPSLVAFPEATDKLIVSSDLLYFTKEFTDDPVAPGGTVNLEFNLTNLADEAVTDIEFSDDLDATLPGLIATGLPISACGGTLDTYDGGMTIDFAGGSLEAAGAAGDSCTFSVTLLVPPDVLLGTAVTNTTSLVTGYLGNGDKLAVTGGPAIDELRISNLDFSKAFDGPAVAGTTTVLTFSIENLDASAGVSGIEFSDDLALVVPGLVATGLPAIDVCGPGSVLDGTSVVSLGGGSLGPGASCTFDVTLNVPMTAAVGTYTNITGTLFVNSAPVGVPAVADLEVESDAAIEITKTPSQPQVFAGNPVSFTIGLRNGGSVNLTNIAISDPLTPDCNRAAGVLPTLVPGGQTSYTCNTTPLFADLINVAIVTADIPAGPPISASATGNVVVLDPAVTITKTPATQQILAGETATFEITVANVGTVGLGSIFVTDPSTPDCARDGSEGSPGLPNLLPGQSVFYSCTTEPLGAGFTNVATVNAVNQNGLPTSASASAVVEVIVPIEIIKSPSEQTILPGTTATFTITLNNPGTVVKTNVVVVDPLTPTCDTTLPSLAAGGTFSYTCTTDPLFANLTNVATVTADTPAGPVGANSTALVDVIDPPLEITKTPDVQLVLPNGTASFTVTVTNPGTDALTSVVVTDPLTPDCDFTVASLPAGGTQSNVCTTGPLTDDFTNVATVTATSIAGEITASASALVNVRNPVEIIKAPAEQSVPFGGTATFTITVTNDGDDVLTDVAVSDPLTPDCDRAAGVLGDLAPMGGQVTYTCTTDALFADLINQATITAQDSNGPVSASDDALVDVLTDLELTKTPTNQQIEAGATATFTITLTNGGTENVTNILVADLMTPACITTVASLAPGAVFAYDCTTEGLSADLVNLATATGLVSGGEVSAIATATVEVIQPLVIIKDPSEQEILAGETAEFTITVSNPSQVTRTDLAVSDPLTPSCDRAVGILGDLAPGASTSYTCTTDSLFAGFTNIATATGMGPAGAVSVSDTAVVIVLDPEISITKTPEAQLVSPGGTASFTITLNNPGPAGLTGLAVSDPLTPDCDRAVGTLPDLPAETSTSYTCQTGPLTADFVNLATVTATSEAGPSVTATASASVNVRNPIEILKAPFEQHVLEGANATFTITINNDGDTLKTNVAVSDPQSPDCARAAGAVPDLDPLGGSFSYTCQSGPVIGDFVNVATVNADSPTGPVTADDNAAVFVLPPDFGDAPTPYPTLLVNNGARHLVSETPFFLGVAFDSEVSGQPNADATGDDTSGIDDEDGVAFPPMALGLTATVDVTLTGTSGLLNAWIDFNIDGDWNDAGEQIMVDEPVVAGVNSLNYTVPIDAAVGDTFARVRLDSGGGLLPTGLAGDGEVEDYMVNIVASFDTVPPTVTLVNSVLDTGDGAIEECETAQVEISKLLVTFSEDVLDPPGDTDPDDVTNPANYLVVAAGPDADFDTSVCGTVFGDDVMVPIHGVTYDGGSLIATLDLGRIPSSLIRLIACGSTSIYDLAGNPLDGNANGTGGDDFVLTFRADPTNLLANGHFDCDADGWILISATPGEIIHSSTDSDASSLSGSLEFMQLGVNTVFSAGQCVPVSPTAETQLMGLAQATIPSATDLSLTAECESFATNDCSGAVLGISSSTAIFGDSGGSWLPVASVVPKVPGRMSVLCGFTVRVPSGDDFTLRLDKLFLGAGTLIFKDGFESGDSSAWSSVVP